MRGNWDQVEPRTLAPEQDQQLQQTMLGNHLKQQQQQQTVLGDQAEQLKQKPPQEKAASEPQQKHQAASTTPGWINDRIVVKEEPVDDKNNDSGISPEHYISDSASPQSHHSLTMTSNCSLSPRSNVSHDSNVIQMNAYPYSPESISPPMDFQASLDYAHAHLGQQASAGQTPSLPISHRPNYPVVNVEEVSSMAVLGFNLPDQLEFAPKPLNCPVCSYASRRRISFSEHIKSHCNVAASMCERNGSVYEFNRSVLKQLLNGSNIGNLDSASPILEDYDLGNSELEFRVPRVNPQGKVKIFRCKQCAFVAMTKVDFWNHSREHIRPEKLLICPKCPFVTEYKHHLEYHLHNHFKSKPYKCDKCDYTCVNKSMLNSHRKAHSSVYQFSCADCSYAAKHCHSLKQHLRKYDHKPATALNTDGSPNPLRIVEPHSTRRGPKTKPKKDEQAQSSNNIRATFMPTIVPMQQQQQQQQQQISPLVGTTPQFQFNPMNGFQGFNGQAMLGFPYTPIFAGFPMTNPITMNVPADAALGGEQLYEKELEQVKTKYLEVTNSLFPERNSPASDSYGFAKTEPPTIKQEKLDSRVSSNALDLSKTDNANVTQAPIAAAASVPAPVSSPKANRTNRRKGRAFKIERRVIANDSDQEMPQEVQRASPTERLEIRPPLSSPASSSGDSTVSAFNGIIGTTKEFTCQFCEMSFGDEVMHSVHMGYHGYKNPYTCNMCGLPCSDKVTFFLHIARVKH